MAMLRQEDGFTLLEVLVVILLMGILMTLSASSLRTYWFTHSLEGQVESVVAQMRQAQQRAGAETHPRAYGVWFTNGSQRWGILQYDSSDTSTPCEETEQRRFETMVRVADVDFTEVTSPATITATCRTALASAGVPDAANAEMVFFYPRGNATAGSLTLEQPPVDKERTIDVVAITGRVDES